MASNLEIQEQLNKMVAEYNKLLEVATRTMGTAADFAQKMAAAIGTINYKDVAQQAGDLKAATEQAAESSTKLGSTSSDTERSVTKSMQESTDKTKTFGSEVVETGKKMSKFGLIAAAAMDGIKSGFSLTLGLLGRFGSLAAGATKLIFNLGKAIITAPFKMLSALMQDTTGGSNELQQAIEDVRKEFGNLKEATGKATLDMARNLKGELANTGLSVYRVFGNLAERLKTMMEYMKELGPLAGVLAGQMAQNAEAIGAFHKGLGLTAEGFKSLGARAHASGTPMTEMLREMGNYSLQLGRAFGLSSKEISRDVGTMMSDFTHFGHLGVKALTQISVYTKRLGIEFKALAGVMDKFANFEDAAQGAAQLSQAFGLNINAIELMKEQDPAKKVEMLRKAFFAAGRSVENMTYQERRLLAAQSGVSEENLNLVFSLKNQNLSYDQVQKRSAAAQKHQLSQVQVLHQLADAIERMVKSGGSGASSFFEIWLKGFRNGIRWSKEFMGLQRNLRVDMRNTFIEGRKVGRMFVESFPGIKNFLGGLRDLFEPRRFRQMIQRTTESFKEFFKALTTDPKTAFKVLLEHLKDDFFSWFQSNSPNGHRMLDGLRTFFRSMSQIMGSMLKQAIIGLTKSITFIVDLLAGRKSLAGLAATGRGAGGFMAQLLIPLLDAIKEAGPGLWVATKALFAELFHKLNAFLAEHRWEIFSVMFGPALVGGVARGILGAVGARLGAMLVSGLSSGLLNLLPSLFSSLGTMLTGSLSSIGLVAAGVLVAALVAGFLFFPKQTQDILSKASRTIEQFVGRVSEYIGIGLGYVIQFLGRLPGYIWTAISRLPEVFTKVLPTIFNALRSALMAVLVTLPQAIINGLLNGIQKGLERVFPHSVRTIRQVMSVVRTVFNAIFSIIRFAVTAVFDYVKSVSTAIGAVLQTTWDVIKAIAGALVDTWHWIGNAATSVWNGIVAVWTGATTFFSELFAGIGSGISAAWDTIKGYASSTWDAVRGGWDAAREFFSGLFSGIADTISRSLERVRQLFDNTFGAARRAVQSVSNVVDRIFGNSVHDVVGRDLRQTTPIANEWSQNLINAARKAEQGMTDSSRRATEQIASNMQNSSVAPTPGGNSLTTNVLGGNANIVDTPNIAQLNQALSVITDLRSQLEGISNQQFTTVSPLIQRMVEDVNNIGTALNQIRPININTGLRRLANNLGLGNSEEFTINHKNFNVQLTVNVRVDAEDLERILIERPNTRFGHTTNTRSGGG
jgi:phage-related protein